MFNQYLLTVVNTEFDRVLGGIFVSENSSHGDFQEVIDTLAQGEKIKAVNILKNMGVDSNLENKSFNQTVIMGSDIGDDIYQGVYLNNVYDMRWTLSHIDKVKNTGFNTILFEVQYLVSENGDLYVPGKEVYLFYLNAFHKSGFKVWLTLGHTAYEFPYRFNSSQYIRGRFPELDDQRELLTKFIPHILEWAEIAQEFQVDAFVPSEEVNTALIEWKEEMVNLSVEDRNYLSLWSQNVLQRVEKVYHGKIGMAVHLSSGDLEDDFDEQESYELADYDYSGYDFVMAKIPFSRSNSERETIWKKKVDYLLNDISQKADESGVKQVAWYETGNPFGDSLNPSVMSHAFFAPKDQKKAYELDFDIASDYENLALFFKVSLSQPNEGNWSPFGNPAEDVLQNHFSSENDLKVTGLDKLWINLGKEGMKVIQLMVSDDVPFDPEYSLDCGYEEFDCKFHELEKRIFQKCRGYICPW